MIRSVYAGGALLLAAATAAGAQQRPPIRQLGAVTAKSAETFSGIAAVRPLSNGSVLVNDVTGRRIIMFDPALSKFTVIADSTSATSNAYSGRMGSLLAFRGDSSIFVDPSSVSMLVIDPSGKVARVMAIPRAEDAMAIGNPFNVAAFDKSGRLVYRAGGASVVAARSGRLSAAVALAPFLRFRSRLILHSSREWTWLRERSTPSE